MDNEEQETAAATSSATKVDILTMLLTNCPQLKAYEVAFRRNGFDSPQAMRFLLVADLSEMKVVPGHRHVLRFGLRRFFG